MEVNCDRGLMPHMFGNCYGSCDFDALCYRLDSGILMLAAKVHFTRIGTVKFF